MASKTGLKLKLIGRDGNAMVILGAAQREMKRAGLDKEKIDEYMKDAVSGDYNHLLSVTQDWFDVK